MEAQLAKIYKWLEAKSVRELAILLLITLLVIYLFWYSLLAGSLWEKQTAVKIKVNNLEQTVSELQTKVTALTIDAAKPVDASVLQQHEQLKQQLNNINQTLAGYKQQVVAPEQMVHALKAMLVASDNLTLIRMVNLPVEAINENATNHERLFKHTFDIELRGDYFSTLAYMQKLEALPWRLYWDTLDYQVVNYPQATIKIQLHILSNQEKLINV